MWHAPKNGGAFTPLRENARIGPIPESMELPARLGSMIAAGGGISSSALAEPVVTGEFACLRTSPLRSLTLNRLAIDTRQSLNLALAGVAIKQF
ncbi:hypothetical protein X747_31705 [Mesorhizobium sp. LNJC384A00]|nr:hypothetical protein X747_31705 [Mesorhizobium sp. LNJC384A00]